MRKIYKTEREARRFESHTLGALKLAGDENVPAKRADFSSLF